MLFVDAQGKNGQAEDGEKQREKTELWNIRVEGRMHPRMLEKDVVDKVIDEHPHGHDQQMAIMKRIIPHIQKRFQCHSGMGKDKHPIGSGHRFHPKHGCKGRLGQPGAGKNRCHGPNAVFEQGHGRKRFQVRICLTAQIQPQDDGKK